jgi:hypothetical protein
MKRIRLISLSAVLSTKRASPDSIVNEGVSRAVSRNR